MFSRMYCLFLHNVIISPVWHSTAHTVQNSWSQVNTKTKIETDDHNLWIISVEISQWMSEEEIIQYGTLLFHTCGVSDILSKST